MFEHPKSRRPRNSDVIFSVGQSFSDVIRELQVLLILIWWKGAIGGANFLVEWVKWTCVFRVVHKINSLSESDDNITLKYVCYTTHLKISDFHTNVKVTIFFVSPESVIKSPKKPTSVTLSRIPRCVHFPQCEVLTMSSFTALQPAQRGLFLWRPPQS